ncbi:hypothetical protein FG386_002448 [Cryptosporidium ryanae]|uniref:uncharacterized protein n=1 Tax=Cryptosporidium ryanae TaxID=515981 RepID=UPI00351A98F4|nr:hypothetical protein FG386_002448 [Cryptosporidium ryanae]
MTFLFVYDHLMDYYEFKRSFPSVEFNPFAIGVIEDYHFRWEAKGIPFVCRKRPTLFSLPNKMTYGVVLRISNYELDMVKNYSKYLSNNLLINVQVQIKREIRETKSNNNCKLKDDLFEKKLNVSENVVSNFINGVTFIAERENLILDKSFIETLLNKRKDILKSKYFKNIVESSKNISPIFPSDKYVENLVNIANSYSIPDEYVKEINVYSKQRLSFVERVVRWTIIKYMSLITKINQQEVGFGIIDLLWELDPNDPLVFEDYGNINNKVLLFMIVLVLFSFFPILSIYSIYVWFKSY